MKRIQFKQLQAHPKVVYGSFLRNGGESLHPFTSLNLSLSVGDDPKKVHINRDRVSKELGVSKVIYAKLDHGTNIERVTHFNADTLPLCDAFFTTEKNLAIAVTHADCQAAIFYDPVHKAVGVVHAGWRGLVQNIYEKMCVRMHQELGTIAKELIVCIAPSIGPDHAEYKNYKKEFPIEFWKYQVNPNYFDFWKLAKSQLISCGVKNIEISKLCTYSNVESYFSYRRDRVTGRHATIISMKE